MTVVRGVRVLEAPCCGQRYAFPLYVSMNFMAMAFWTDGWREESLMPNDEGLRHCRCGRFMLVRHLRDVDTADSSDLPWMDHVADDALLECLARTDDQDLEVAARLTRWRQLNHPYRAQYRQHREAEEAATKAQWEAANPDRRNWWDKLRGQMPPVYARSLHHPFTCPAFSPSPELLDNMARLTALLRPKAALSGHGNRLQLAELYREQGQFDEAEQMLPTHDEQHDAGAKGLLISSLIKERQSAPTRYRL